MNISRNTLVNDTFDLEKAPVSFLLFMRLLLDEERSKSTLEQDINDLYAYPERLHESYKDEWRSWIKNTVHRQAFTDANISDEEALQRFLQKQHDEKAGFLDETYAAYKKVVKQADIINSSNNVKPISKGVPSSLDALTR